jgi:hypothetical protein
MKLQEELALKGKNLSPTHPSSTEVQDTSGSFFIFWMNPV